MAYTPTTEEIKKITDHPETIMFWRVFTNVNKAEYESFCTANGLDKNNDESVAHFYYSNLMETDPTKRAAFEKKRNTFAINYQNVKSEGNLADEITLEYTILTATAAFYAQIHGTEYQQYCTNNALAQDEESVARFYDSKIKENSKEFQAENKALDEYLKVATPPTKAEWTAADDPKNVNRARVYSLLNRTKYKTFLTNAGLEDNQESAKLFYMSEEKNKAGKTPEKTTFESIVSKMDPEPTPKQIASRLPDKNPQHVRASEESVLFAHINDTEYASFGAGLPDGPEKRALFALSYEFDKLVGGALSTSKRDKYNTFHSILSNMNKVPTNAELDAMSTTESSKLELFLHVTGNTPKCERTATDLGVDKPKANALFYFSKKYDIDETKRQAFERQEAAFNVLFESMTKTLTKKDITDITENPDDLAKKNLYRQLHEEQYKQFATEMGLDPDAQETTAMFYLSHEHSKDPKKVEQVTQFNTYTSSIEHVDKPDVEQINKNAGNPDEVAKWNLYRQTHQAEYAKYLEDTGFEDNDVALATFVFGKEHSTDLTTKTNFSKSKSDYETFLKEYFGDAKPNKTQLDALTNEMTAITSDSSELAKWTLYSELHPTDNANFLSRYGFEGGNNSVALLYINTKKPSPTGYKGNEEKLNSFNLYWNDFQNNPPSTASIKAMTTNMGTANELSVYYRFHSKQVDEFVEKYGLEDLPEDERIARYMSSKTGSKDYNTKNTFSDELDQIESMKVVYQPSDEQIEAALKPENFPFIAAYSKTFSDDYRLFCTLQGIDPNQQESMAWFVYAERYDAYGNERTDANSFNKRANSIADVNLEAKQGDTSGQSMTTETIEIGGTSYTSVSHVIELKNKGSFNLQGDQKISVIDDNETMLAVTQTDPSTGKPQTISKIVRDPATGKCKLVVDAAYYDELVKDNPELQKIVESQKGNPTYEIEIEQVKLSKDMSIDGIQFAGTDGKSYSVLFTALGCQITDGTTKSISGNNNKPPFDITISTQFLNHSLSGDPVCQLGDNLFNPANPNNNPEFSNIMMSALELNPGGVEIGEGSNKIRMQRCQVGKNGETLNVMSIGDPPEHTYVYMQVEGEEPKFHEVKDANIQYDTKSKEYLLSLNIGGGDHVHVPLNKTKVASGLTELKKGPLGNTFDNPPEPPTEKVATIKTSPYKTAGFAVYESSGEKVVSATLPDKKTGAKITSVEKEVSRSSAFELPKAKDVDPVTPFERKTLKDHINGKTLALAALFTALAVFLPIPFAILAQIFFVAYAAKISGAFDLKQKVEDQLTDEEYKSLKIDEKSRKQRTRAIEKMNVEHAKNVNETREKQSKLRKQINKNQQQKAKLEKTFAKVKPGSGKWNRLKKRIDDLNKKIKTDEAELSVVDTNLQQYELAFEKGIDAGDEIAKNTTTTLDTIADNETTTRIETGNEMMEDAVKQALRSGEITIDQVEDFKLKWARSHRKIFKTEKSSDDGKGGK